MGVSDDLMYLNEYNVRSRGLSREKLFGVYFCQNPPRFHGGQALLLNTLGCIINALMPLSYRNFVIPSKVSKGHSGVLLN